MVLTSAAKHTAYNWHALHDASEAHHVAHVQATSASYYIVSTFSPTTAMLGTHLACHLAHRPSYQRPWDPQ